MCALSTVHCSCLSLARSCKPMALSLQPCLWLPFCTIPDTAAMHCSLHACERA